RLLERLGQGGMGTVYKALHTKLDRVVALKVLATGRMAEQRAIARFEREMRAVGGLDHPNIVRAFDAREIDGLPVLMMECLEGMDLARVTRRLGRVPVADACEMARQTSSALQYAYENGLVHRDVKPSNLMLTPQGTVKLLDLGLARWHLDGTGSEEMTATGQAMGTADYMAPEQVADSHTADIRADIYSLGCTLYKLITGRAPFAGPDYQGQYEKMTAHVEQPVRPIRELAPEVPEPLAQIIDRMLAKSPDARFSIPEEVGRELEPFCDNADLAALAARAEEAEPPTDTDGQSLVTAGSRSIVAGSPHPIPAAGSRFNRRRPLWILLGMLGPLAVALGIIILIQRDGETTKIDVPDGANVKISEDGKVAVNLDGSSAASTDVAHEGAMTTLPTYRIEPPDILQIEMLKQVPKGPCRVEPLDVLTINVSGVFADKPIDGDYKVDADGTIDLGPVYGGTVSVVGKRTEEVGTAVVQQLRKYLPEAVFALSVELAQSTAMQPVTGQYLVGPDGRINLRKYGTVDVAGKTVAQATEAVKKTLSEYFQSPEVSVDVVAYNSKVYYIVTEGAQLGDDIINVPITGKETVLNAIAHIGKTRSQLSDKHLWIARPTADQADGKILPIDLAAIIRGNTQTNYQIFPDDRLIISDRPYGETAARPAVDIATGPSSNQEALLGTWEVVKYVHPSRSENLVVPMDSNMAPEEAVEGVAIVIAQDGFKVLGDLVKDINFEYQVNPEASPRLIEFRGGMYGMMVSGKDYLGIYDLDGDTLKICVAERSKGRPSEFWVEYGSNAELFVLRRASKAVSGPDEDSFQGTWEVISADLRIDEMTHFGASGGTNATSWPTYSAPYGELAPGLLVKIDQRTIVVDNPLPIQPADRDNPEFTAPLWRTQYVLGGPGAPGTLETASFGRHVCSGIYRLEGDRLTIRLGKDNQRPADLDAPPADEEAFLVLKRVGDAPIATTEEVQKP
ncbi:MAG TPA: protein kinase, partial [Thermoguttaceae bacterium]|nr:protein kinase [Thermoguttaceae bacterium]